MLADLVASFGVDVSFLRYNDHAIRATKLVAEWPPRPTFPTPTRSSVVYFADADPVFARRRDMPRNRCSSRPSRSPEDRRLPAPVEEGSGRRPALAGIGATAVRRRHHRRLGFIKFGIKDWSPEELNALKAIASLFAQVQARVVAEDQLRYLAEHDDLTGLHNRRALLAYLDDRLRAGRPGPVSALFLDLDRLKAINDYLGHHAGDWFIQAFAERLTRGDRRRRFDRPPRW